MERVPAEEEDALPSDGRDFLQSRDRGLVAGHAMPVQHGREQDGVVGDDDQGEQPAALVGEEDVEIGVADQLLPTGDLGDCRAQLMIGLDPVLRAVDVTLQLRAANILQRVEAAHQLVVFEDGLAGAVLGRERAQLVDQRGLAGFLERQGGHDTVEGIVLAGDQASVDLAGRLKEKRGIAADVVGTEKMRDLRLEAGEARSGTHAEPVEDGEVGLVDAVHVTGNDGRPDLCAVAVADIEEVLAFMLVGTDQHCLERHVAGEQTVGDDAFARAEVLARIPGLDGRLGRGELLSVDGAVKDIRVDGVEREDGQTGDEVADSVAAVAQCGGPDVLTVGRFEHVVGDIAGLGHAEVAETHGAGHDHGHQFGLVGDLLGIAGLERRQGRQEAASLVDEAEDIDDGLGRQVIVEAVLAPVRLFGLGPAPSEAFALRVEVDMREPPVAEILVEALPLSVQRGAELVDSGPGRVGHPRDREGLQDCGRFLGRHEFVTEAAVTQTVVDRKFACRQTLGELPVDPELVAVAAQTDRGAGFIELVEMTAQLFGDRAVRDISDRPLAQRLLTGEDRAHPGQRRTPGIGRRDGRDVQGHDERAQVLLDPWRGPIDLVPTQLHLADGILAQPLAGTEQRLSWQDGEGPLPDHAERRGVVDGLIEVEQQDAAHLWRLLLPLGLGLDEGFQRIGLGLVLDSQQVVVEGIDEVVAELAEALPSVAQQVKMGLRWPHPSQVVDCVDQGEVGVAADVLLRDAERRQQGFGGLVDRRQRCAFQPLGGHHLVSEVAGVLLESGQRGQLDQRPLPHEQIAQRFDCLCIERGLDQEVQVFALDRQGGADHGLQRGVAGAHDLAIFQYSQQLEPDEARRHVPPGQLGGGLDEGRAIGFRPEPEAEHPGDLGPLSISLAASQPLDANGGDCCIRKVAVGQEGNVFGWNRLCGQIEEGVLSLEVAKLQQAVQAIDRSPPPIRQGKLGPGKGKELRALEVVEIGEAVEGEPLLLGEDGQPPAAGCARLLVASQGALSRRKRCRTFPITTILGKVIRQGSSRRLPHPRRAGVAPIIILGKVGS